MLLPMFDRSAQLAAALLLLGSMVCRADVLFRDDFNASALDAKVWSVADWTLGRTQFASTPLLSGGVARLTLQTYDPGAPGVSLLGTEIDTRQSFALNQGLEISARVRLAGVSDGAVASLFTYATTPAGATNEMDVELLSKQLNHPGANGPTVALTSWQNWLSIDGHGNGPNHWSISPALAGLDVSSFNTFTIRWLPGEVQWLVNDQPVAQTNEAVPATPMPLQLNFWAPLATWTEAYSAALKPTADPTLNQVFSYEIDSIVVSSVPEPGTPALFGFGLALLSGWRSLERAVRRSAAFDLANRYAYWRRNRAGKRD